MPSKVRNPDAPSQSFRYFKKWRLDRAKGLKRLTTPDAAQAHVQGLVQQHGVSIRSIADAAGIDANAISLLNRGLKKSLSVVTEKKILSVTAQTIFDRPNALGFVPNIGARRRVQALLAIGWRHQDIDERCGVRTGTMLHQVGDWISQAKHDAIKDVYDELWATPGPRRRATETQYAPPMAWDDDTIDDPNATPDLGTKVARQGPRSPEADVVGYSEALTEDVAFLVRTGAGTDEIEQRIGCKWTSIERALHRAGRGDLIAAVKNPVRDNARKAGSSRRAA